jgi:AcrR family transcriptional regulator
MPKAAANREKLLNAGLRKEVRTRGPSPEKTAQTRCAVVSAALVEFLEKGFADATMESVARRAGVAKGTPYRYFPTKEALFSGVVQQEIAGAFIGFDASQRETSESIEAFLRRSILAATKDIERKGRAAIARLVIVEGVRFPALVEIYRLEMIDPLLDRIRRLLAEARQAGELRNDLLVHHPHLVLAPILTGIINNQLLDTAHPLDIPSLLEMQLDLIFQRN